MNVLEDYRAALAAPAPAGTAVLTGAGDTRSRAEGHYASFRVRPP